MKKILLISLLAMLWSNASVAVVEQQVFSSAKIEQRYNSLINEFRCLVCQNQNLADSDAPLAKDLRRITAEMLSGGSSDAEIRDFMRERYGDFVLYRPPFNLKTSFLWLGPMVFLVGTLVALAFRIRRRQNEELIKTSKSGDEAQRVKVRNLLRDAPKIDSKK